MWIDEDAADPAEVERAMRGLELLCGAALVETSSSDRDGEVVVSVSLPAGLRGERATVEMCDGVLLVHLPRARG